MAITNHHKYVLILALCSYSIMAMVATLIYVDIIKVHKVHVLSFKDVDIGRSQVELTNSTKSTIGPTTMTNTLNKTDVNTTSLKKVLTLDRGQECLNMELNGRNCSRPDWFPGDGTNDRYFKQCLKTVITHGDICFERTGEKKDVFLLLLVSSLPSHFERRQAIRETWGKQRVFFGKQTVLLFTLATETNNTAEIQKKVNEENERHGDIIQAEFRESFHNLTLKVVFGLKWVTENCPHTKYYYKGDDDMFVNMKNIIQFLEKLSKEKHKAMFIGNAMWTSIHIDDAKSRYHVSKKQYRGKFYPPYCSGGGYVISGSTIPAMYEAAQRTSIIPIDDAYHGILAKRIGVPITHNSAFKVFGSEGKNMHKCFLQESMVSHKYGTADSLRKAWTNFTDISIKCPE